MKFTSLAALAFAFVSTGAEAKLKHKVHKRAQYWTDYFFDQLDDTVDQFLGHVDEQADKIMKEVDSFVNDNEDTFKTINDVSYYLKHLPQDIKNVSEHADVAVDYFDFQADLRGYDLLPVKNTTCITRHCTGAIASCIAEDTCRKNLQCNAGCGVDNSACQVTCSYSYESERLDKLFQCLIVDHECLSLPPPDPINNATNRDPQNTVKDVDGDLLRGDWYIVFGANPVYDCFDCAMQNFNVTSDGDVIYHAVFNMIASNKSEIWIDTALTGDITSNPGHIVLKGTDNGLPDHQTWYVLLLNENTLVTYYYGGVMDSWHFEGFLVMSRDTALHKDDEDAVAALIEGLDFPYDQLCALEPAKSCPNAAAAVFLQ